MSFSIQTNTLVVQNSKPIFVSKSTWQQSWLGLKERGRGEVESAAIWAGRRDADSETVEAVYFLDDLNDQFQDYGYHYVSTKAVATLFATLHKHRRVIIADIHTHPGQWVGLSGIDKDHPIEFRKGLCAIVLPHFAQVSPSLSAAGIHEYCGDGKWKTLSKRAKEKRFIFT